MMNTLTSVQSAVPLLAREIVKQLDAVQSARLNMIIKPSLSVSRMDVPLSLGTGRTGAVICLSLVSKLLTPAPRVSELCDS